MDVAARYREIRGARRLRSVERARPRPRSRQLLVKVAYASVNPVDWKIRNALAVVPFSSRLPVVPGFDVAGEVVETGPGTVRFAVGDQVFAQIDSFSGGASAEYARVGEDAAARVPAGMSAREAAALPMVGLTAWRALHDKAKVAAGERVLVIGASGGVGHLAVQIAKAAGAHVTAVCSGRNAAMVRGLGADEVIDYTISDPLGEGAYDVVFDAVGKATSGAAALVLAPGGRFVTTMPRPEFFARAPVLPLLARRRARFVMSRPSGRVLNELVALIEAGKLRVVIDSEYPLERLADAHERSRSGHAAGKIVVRVSS